MTKSSEGTDLVVVTGASTGLGAATAHALAHRGFHVLAGVRRPTDGDRLRATAPQSPDTGDRPHPEGDRPHSKGDRPHPEGDRPHSEGDRPHSDDNRRRSAGDPSPTGGVEPVILDITDPQHIAALADRVEADPRPLRALINNAGIPVAGPVEATPLDEWRRLFEVNLFGHIAVTQALLPALLRHRGRVVNISSVNGRLSLAGYGPYASSKFALEAMSDALRNELAPSGVPVVVVEPGGIKTEMANYATTGLRDLRDRLTPAQNERYGDLVRALPRHVAAFTAAGTTAGVAAETVARAVTDRRPRTRYVIGARARFLVRAAGLLPDRVLDRLTTSDLHKHYPAATAG